MANSMYFVQECPTCGRGLQIRVEYLGRQVVCQHCRGKLTACDPESHRYSGCDEAESLLLRGGAPPRLLAADVSQPQGRAALNPG